MKTFRKPSGCWSENAQVTTMAQGLQAEEWALASDRPAFRITRTREAGERDTTCQGCVQERTVRPFA